MNKKLLIFFFVSFISCNTPQSSNKEDYKLLEVDKSILSKEVKMTLKRIDSIAENVERNQVGYTQVIEKDGNENNVKSHLKTVAFSKDKGHTIGRTVNILTSAIQNQTYIFYFDSTETLVKAVSIFNEKDPFISQVYFTEFGPFYPKEISLENVNGLAKYANMSLKLFPNR